MSRPACWAVSPAPDSAPVNPSGVEAGSPHSSFQRRLERVVDPEQQRAAEPILCMLCVYASAPSPGPTIAGCVFAPHMGRLCPTPWPDLWHVSSSRKQATEEPVPTDEVGVLLEAWNFTADHWVHWAGPPHEKNPDPPPLWEAYGKIGRGS
jgi:hypothetical protein